MYHTHFRGTHYDIGFRYGSALRKNGKFILNNVPFPVGEEQFAFAAVCRPLYEVLYVLHLPFSGISYSFIGNTTAFAEMEDGINEHGLAIGLTMVQSNVLKPG